ncbi:ABC transporter substrate-binding protein [Haloferax mediterranei ATCC 33500]|nr:ferrichrome-binding protein [Haloferax mediterranei ATCC 33500]AHZ22941.1 ABC transporter substrate-binding protein [Haloferax mediterranei ATCC 33500]QCQ76562.1 ABC transporter substrate-binding protein [Haloferax mediterranei ATCC 33500]
MNETEPTRRAYLKYAGAVAAGGLLAGCTADGSTEAQETTTGGTASPETTESETEQTTVKPEESYSVSMAPVGTVEFDAPPEHAMVVFSHYADMAVALGQSETVESLYAPEFAGKSLETFYARLDGVSLEWDGLPDPLSDGVDKEMLYELDSDVHFVDPSYVVETQDGWDTDDIEEIADNVAPWFGNYHSGLTDKPAAAYVDNYRYYTLWELFENVAAVYQERQRYEALRAVYDDVVSEIESSLPPEPERPTAARVTLIDDTFYAYKLNAPGFWHADTRPLGATDAFADIDWDGTWGMFDYETMLETDPDVILHLWGMSPGYYIDDIRKRVANHPVGSQLSAVQNDRFFAGGVRFQGPITNLFQLELTAKQLYPEVFGQWPGYVPGEPYPEIPEDEQLFDRKRVADIVAGEP